MSKQGPRYNSKSRQAEQADFLNGNTFCVLKFLLRVQISESGNFKNKFGGFNFSKKPMKFLISVLASKKWLNQKN